MSQENDDGPISLGPDDDEPIVLSGPTEAAPEVDEPISLVGSESSGPSQVRMSKRFADRTELAGNYERTLNITGTGATRCRIFHAKVSIAALEMMQKQINEWLDGDEIEVKQICQTMGTMKGKMDEENVIVTVWY